MSRNIEGQQPATSHPPAQPGRHAERQDPVSLGGLVWGSGWFGVAGGVLLVVDAIAHLFVDDTTTPTELLGLPHELWHLPGVIGITAALIGLLGIYLHQAPRAGKLGLVGFVLLFIGVTLGAAYSTIFHAVFLPALEGVQDGLFQEFIDTPATGAQAVRGITVQAVGLGLGAILFGAATIRAGVLPRLGGWLIVAAALFAAANEAFDAAQLISRVLFGAVFVLLGSAIVKDSKAVSTAV